MFWFKKRRIKSEISYWEEVIKIIHEITEILEGCKDLTDKGIGIDFNFDVKMKNQLLVMQYYKEGVLDVFGTHERYTDNGFKKIKVKDHLLQLLSSPDLDGQEIDLMLRYFGGFEHGLKEKITELKKQIT